MSRHGHRRDARLDELARLAADDAVDRGTVLRRGIGLMFAALIPAPLVARAGVAEAELFSTAKKCPPSDVLCSGVCTNLATNTSHCGKCGHACPSGSRCIRGQCTTCKPDETRCHGKCVKLASHPKHCGTCGNECPPGARCVKGNCVTEK
jgi:Stigma-specific protein, Stig1